MYTVLPFCLSLNVSGLSHALDGTLLQDQRRIVSFRHSIANYLQYFNLSRSILACGFPNISVAVETSPVNFKCCFSHDISSSLILLSAREILVSITAEISTYCFCKYSFRGEFFSNSLARSKRFTSLVRPKIWSSARPFFV